MARLFSPEFALGQQQQRLQERRLQLENDPSRIFLRSFSQTAPQQLTRGLVEMGLGLGDYYLLGGKRKQEAAEAVAIPGLAPSFVEKNYPDIYARSPEAQARRQAKASREMDKALGPPGQKKQRGLPSKPSQPQQGFQVKAPKKPVIKELGPDRFGLEIEDPSSRHPVFKGLPVDETGAKITKSGGKTYRIIDGKQKDRIMADYNKASSARKQYLKDEKESQQSGSSFVVPGDLPSPEKVGQVAKQQAKEPTYGFESLQRSQQMSLSTPQIQMPERPSTFAPQQQFSDYTKAESANRRKLLEETQKQAQNRKKDLQTQAESQLKRLYDFLPQVSSEELVRQKEVLDVMIAQEPNGDTKQMLMVLRSQMPSEEFRSTAAAYIGKAGNRRWSKISKSLPTRINVAGRRNLREIRGTVDDINKKYLQNEQELGNKDTTSARRQELLDEQVLLKAEVKILVSDPNAKELIRLDPSTGMPYRGVGFTREATGEGSTEPFESAAVKKDFGSNPQKYASALEQNKTAENAFNELVTAGKTDTEAMAIIFKNTNGDFNSAYIRPKSGKGESADSDYNEVMDFAASLKQILTLNEKEIKFIKNNIGSKGSQYGINQFRDALSEAAYFEPAIDENGNETDGRLRSILSNL